MLKLNSKYLLILFSCFVLLLLTSCGRVEQRVVHWKQLLEQELPIGSDFKEVEVFLQQQSFEYGCQAEIKRCFALELDVEDYLIVNYSVVIIWNFDQDLKLISFSVGTEGDGS